MIIVPVPAGWQAFERHLNEWHGITTMTTDAMDSDELRRLHRVVHTSAPAWSRRPGQRAHTHPDA